MLKGSNYCIAAAAILVVALLMGCSSGSGTVKVDGNVTFEGQPVEKGEIIFTPAGGEIPSVASPIENGKYECAVPLGRNQVRISAYREVPGKVDRSNPGQESPAIEMYIPEKYNSNSTLEVTIDSSETTHDFTLTAG